MLTSVNMSAVLKTSIFYLAKIFLLLFKLLKLELFHEFKNQIEKFA